MVKVAVVQAAPVLFNKEKSVQRVYDLTLEASKEGSRIILFPEAFIPAYPRGLSFGMVVGSRTPEGRKTWERFWLNSIDIPGPETELMCEAAREAEAYVAVGVMEKDTRFSGRTLFCTLLYISPKGEILGKHRKLKPTGAERLIWGEGDGSGLIVLNTEYGKIGGLICWENYMPLARMALFGKGVEIYFAPTADFRPTWQATLVHIACEGRCYVLGCNQFVTKSMYPQDLVGVEEISSQPEIMSRGGSAIVSPLGEVIAGPLYDREGILSADLDLSQISKARLDFDVVGHYSRPDVFRLEVNEREALPVSYVTEFSRR